MNLVPLRPLEKISNPQKCSLKQCYETTFFRQYFADLLETFGSKKIVLNYTVHFFNAFSFDLGYSWGPPSPVLVTGTAAIIGVCIAKTNLLLNPYIGLG